MQIAKYHNENLARQACERSIKNWLVLGDINDPMGKFWIVRPVDAAKLQRAGYELAK